MATLLVPTRTDPNEYNQRVLLDGVAFRMLFKYNAREDFWYMDLRDDNGVGVKLGMKLLTGFSLTRLIADIDLRPAGVLMMIDATDADQEAGLLTIGQASSLLYIQSADVPEGAR